MAAGANAGGAFGSPMRGGSSVHSADETMGAFSKHGSSGAFGGGPLSGHSGSGAFSGGGGSDGGASAMSIDSFSAHGGAHGMDGGGGLHHSASDKTLKGLDSEELSSQLGLVGVKRSGSGVLSPPRAPDRKVQSPAFLLLFLCSTFPTCLLCCSSRRKEQSKPARLD